MAQILSPICLLKPQIWGIPPETVTLAVLPFHFFQNPLKTGRKTPDIPPDFFTACKFPKNSPIVNPYLYESTLHYLGVHIVLITSAII